MQQDLEKSIAVVGLGYVGLPLALLAARKGYRVIGIDINAQKVKLLQKKIAPFLDEKIEKELKTTALEATTEFAKIGEVSIIIMCVPTPVYDNHLPNLEPVESACNNIAPHLRRSQLVILESTVNPGVCDEIVLPLLEKGSGLKGGVDFYLAHCPERVNPGDKRWSVENIPRVLGALERVGLLRATKFYESILNAKVKHMGSLKEAEAVKIVENSFRDVNIAFVNELACSFSNLGIDVINVIEGAATKPFSFIPHYPGCGVGGHCFDKNTKIFLVNNNHHKIKSIGPYIDSLECKKEVVKGSEIFYPQNVKVLSFDMIKNQTLFKPVTIASKRKTKDLLRIICPYNYKLEVTDLHPVIVYDHGLKVKLAKDLKIGDKLVLNKSLPEEKNDIKIDVIGHLDDEILSKKIRVKPINTKFSRFKGIIDKGLMGDKREYYRRNFLPLKKFLEIEGSLGIKRDEILLCTGRGPSFRKFPAVVDIDKDFLRLIGYYLSEGCITKDKSSRIRFTFNKNEKEYINDLKSILNKHNLKYSSYIDKKFDSYCIKVSSDIFGFILKDILKCGSNCYNMQIPEIFFDLKKPLKEEILRGLFRGDGGVSWYSGKRNYAKAGKLFTHRNNSIEISYFTSSRALFGQVMLFLLNQDIVPRLSKREGYLLISGPKYVAKVKDWFLGEKKKKIENYLKNISKEIDYKKTKVYKNLITIKVEKVEKVKTDYVYSMEVEDTNTLITSNGIIAHNCIPVDPYYLIDYAKKKKGFSHDFLSLARQINNGMPRFTAGLLLEALKQKGISINDAKVAVLGLAYKPEVDDCRESPAFEIIRILEEQGMHVTTYDPFVLGRSSVDSIDKALNNVCAAIIVTAHEIFRKLGSEFFLKNKVEIIIDGRNCLSKEELVNAGILYRGIGR